MESARKTTPFGVRPDANEGTPSMLRQRLLCFAIGLAAVPTGAFAQGGAAPQGGAQSGVLEEIVVTAERREASLQDVPVPVTALTAETLETRQVVEARDLARYAPSLKMFYNITSPTNLSPSLRGSLQQDASLIVAESPFGIYVDDVYIARLNGNNVTLADIERVEVLRGPQGTLYGRNTLAGAIKFVSRTPSADSSWFNASVGAGNFGQQRGSFSWGGPVSDSGWGASLSALYTSKDGHIFNRHPSVQDDRGGEQSTAVRGKLAYSGIENLNVVASVSYSDSKNDAAQLIPAGTPSVPATRQFTSDDLVPQFGRYVLSTPSVLRTPAPLTQEPKGRTKQTIGSLNISYDFGAVTLKSITGVVQTNDFFSTDFSGNGLVNGANKSDSDQYSQELQALGKAFDDRLNYLVGIYYFKEDGTQNFAWNAYAPFPPVNAFTAIPISSSTIEAETTSYSVFGQVDYNFTDNLKATLGLRYTKDDKDFSLAYRALYFPPLSTNIVLANEYTETTPRFGIDYKVDTDAADSLLLYASAARGFKSGGYSGIAIYGADDARSPYFPESNWTYEAGIKTDLLDNRLRINANYYLAKVEDLALNATVINNGAASFPVQNAGEAEIKGLEFEITAVPLDGLTLTLSGTALTDGEYTSLRAGSAPANAPMNLGVTATPPQLPDFSYTLGVDYGFDVPVGRMSFGADWFQTDDYITSATNDFKVKGYGQGNAYIGLDVGEAWSVKAQVRNFTDEDTITTGSRGFLGGFIPLRPREYMFTVTYRLD
jgi:iron complex outermembrane recepter protein